VGFTLLIVIDRIILAVTPDILPQIDHHDL